MKHQQEKLDAGWSETTKTKKVWFITGTSRGFGRIWAEAALQRGDMVAATARNVEAIADLEQKYPSNVLALKLDVTKAEEVSKAVKNAHQHFGRIDVVVNNAAYALVGTIEEVKIEEVKAMYDTNLFGTLNVIQAVLPLLREQGSGHIIGISSNLGHVTLPVIGYYCSSKWAFEAIHESLAEEIRAFGIKVTIVEPGAYATEFGSDHSLKFTRGLDIYGPFKANFLEGLHTLKRGDPRATPQALFQIVDSPQPPLRFFLGSGNLSSVRAAYEERLATWEAWARASDSAQGNEQ